MVTNAVELLARLQALGIEVEVRDGRLITRRPPEVAIPPDLAEAIRAHRDELIALLTGGDDRFDRFDRFLSAITPHKRAALVCPSCGADDLHPDDAAMFGNCVQCGAPLTVSEAAVNPDRPVRAPEPKQKPSRPPFNPGSPEHFRALAGLRRQRQRAGRVPEAVSPQAAGTCPSCGAGLRTEDLEKYGDCPRCRQTLPGWEDVPTPAGPTTQKGDSRDSVSS